MRPIVIVEGLGKQYRLGARRLPYSTLRESLVEWAALPWRCLRQGIRRPAERVWALRDVSFEVHPGEVVGVIGRNGAGKSTLLKILSRITEPTEGSALLYGRVGSLLEVGSGFHPELTGRENIYLNGVILGMRRAEVTRKFDQIVAFAEIEKFLDTPVKHYSSGMYVRLAFAVAAHLEPEILIVDEVLAVGDAAFQKKCLGKMEEVATGGRTVLFVSHSQGAVQQLCTRAILIDRGQLLYEGSVQETFARYAGMAANQAVGRADLTHQPRPHCCHQQYARLHGISLLDGSRNPAELLVMGQTCSFVLDLDILQTSMRYEIGISISNLHGVALHYLISNWEGFEPGSRLGQQRIEVEMSPMHLFPGDYQVTVWVKQQGQVYDDAVEEALRFRVEEGQITRGRSYFGSYSRNTQVYASSVWKWLD